MGPQKEPRELEYRGLAQAAPTRRLAGWMVAAATLGVTPSFVLAVLWWRLLKDTPALRESRHYLMMGGLAVLIVGSLVYSVLLVCSTWRVLHGRAVWRRWVAVVARGYGILVMVALGLDVTGGWIDATTYGLRLSRLETLAEVGLVAYCVVTVQVNWWMIRACDTYVDSAAP